MKKLLSLVFVLLCLLLIGCSKNENETTLFDYDFTLNVPKGATIGDDFQAVDTSSPYFDKYHVTAKSEDSVIYIKVEGDYFEPFEVSINPEVKALDCRSMMTLKDGEEKKIISSAATYTIGLYYGAQKGEKEIPLEAYAYSEVPKYFQEYYDTIASFFCKFDPKGNIISYGIYDLMFNDFFGNVVKKENGAYTANITLSYSYILKQQASEDKEIFDDVTLGVDMTYENGKWVVVDIETPLIIKE